MTTTDIPVPLAMLAARLLRVSEADFLARLNESGHAELRMRHPLVLQALEPDGARLGELAAQLGVSQQAVGELIDQLESRGYVERHPDPADRRARRVTLTARGADAVSRCYVIIKTMEQEYADRVGASNYLAVREALSALIEQLEAR